VTAAINPTSHRGQRAEQYVWLEYLRCVMEITDRPLTAILLLQAKYSNGVRVSLCGVW